LARSQSFVLDAHKPPSTNNVVIWESPQGLSGTPRAPRLKPPRGGFAVGATGSRPSALRATAGMMKDEKKIAAEMTKR
jgi:hypothetical protein